MSTPQTLEALVAPSRATAITEAIRQAILSGVLAAGAPLVEAELARQFGTSKTPVRDALRTLAGTGLVVFTEYRGAIVRSVDADMARNVFDVRRLLEPVAVARTVEAAGFDVEDTRRALEVAANAASAAQRSLANRDFHQALFSGCGNPVLVQTLTRLRDQTALISISVWGKAPTWEQEAEEHRKILQAAERGKAERAAELVRQHIDHFEERALSILDTDDEQ